MKVATPPAQPAPDLKLLRTISSHPEYFKPEQDGRYLHWDELRHRPSPKGVTREGWWWAIRLARTQLARPLELRDQKGRPFTFAMTDTVQRMVHEIDRDASGQIALPEDVTDPGTRDRYVVNSLIEEAFRSSQLEGASTTRAVAKEMIQTKRKPRTDSEQMILNNFYAMEWVRENKARALTPSAVFELHEVVTRDTLDGSAAGRFRKSDEPVQVVDLSNNDALHLPPPAEQLPERMAALCRLANGTSRDEPFIHPVARAIMLHFWLAYDHPFVDGSGRTARALFYWSMLHQDYWLTEFISISGVIHKARSQYDKAYLYSESDHNDATYFLLHQLRVLRKAIDELHEYLKRKTREVRTLEHQLRSREDLNNRQLAVINEALRHPDARITIEGHRTMTRVVYQTARTDLLGLVTLGYLTQRKIGKKLYFEPVGDLARKLKPLRESNARRISRDRGEGAF